jgi:repressor of nif and glnA expression
VSVYIERKFIAILRILEKSNGPLGARMISRFLEEEGIYLTERAVRFHLQLMDERNLTRAVGRQNRAGREITDKGREELGNALVSDKVGMVSSKMDEFSYRTSLDLNTKCGKIILNVSMIRKSDFTEAINIAKEAFDSGISIGQLVVVADEGKKLGNCIVPKGMKALGTVCAVTINGVLLYHRIPVKSRFGGILQMENNQPVRFTEIIEYSGSSLDPAEIFIKSKMTSVLNVARSGAGKVLAGFREIPIACLREAEYLIKRLDEIGLSGTISIGEPNQSVLQIPVSNGYVGLVVLAGLNPLAAVEEAGIETRNMTMCTLADFQELSPLSLNL